jgi:hypothetical protein
LGSGYPRCEILTHPEDTEKIVRIIEKPSNGVAQENRWLIYTGFGAIIILFLFIGGALLLRRDFPSFGGFLPASATDTPTATQTAELIEIPEDTNDPEPTETNTAIPTFTLTSTPDITNTPIPTSTPEILLPTPGPAMKTPFGPDQRFILHTVAESESYSKLAEMYKTSPEMIQSLNDLIEGANLWVNTVLVIMPGQIDPTGIPKFKILFIDSEESIDILAEIYNLSADELVYYNSLGEDGVIPAGRYIIIPIAE